MSYVLQSAEKKKIIISNFSDLNSSSSLKVMSLPLQRQLHLTWDHPCGNNYKNPEEIFNKKKKEIPKNNEDLNQKKLQTYFSKKV